MEWEPIAIFVSGALATAALWHSLREARQRQQERKSGEQEMARRTAEARMAMVSEVSRQLDRMHMLARMLVTGATGGIQLPPIMLQSIGPSSNAWLALQDSLRAYRSEPDFVGKLSHFFSLVGTTEELLKRVEELGRNRQFNPVEPPFAAVLLTIAGNVLAAQKIGDKIVSEHGTVSQKDDMKKRAKQWDALDERLAENLARESEKTTGPN